MRIRSTKPEFWRSERIARVDWEARLVLKGLESYVDDNGVGRDDLALIVGDLFQRDLVREPSRTLARVSEAISQLCEAGLLHRYEHDGTSLLYLSFWEMVQRVDKPQGGRFPRPDGTLHYKDSVIRESVANIRESSRALAPGTGEQGNRGIGEQEVDDAPRPDVVSLCDHLHKRITENGSKVKINAGWHKSARLMLDTDKRDVGEAHRLIDWCQDSDFWRPNILAMPKFRAKYDTLRLQAGSNGQLRLVPNDASGLTREQIESVLGPDGWSLPQPPSGVLDGDPAEYRAWARSTTDEHHADRVRAALAKLGRTS